jgi:hypothetical protein
MDLATDITTQTKENLQILPIEVAATKKVLEFLDLPSNLPPFFEFRSGNKKGVGMSWLGTYMNANNWRKSYEAGKKIMENYGLVRFLIPFNKAEKGESETVRKMLGELVDATLPLGAIPYKCPAWAAKKVFKVMDPNWIALAKKIRKALDPNGIMNPDRWALLD